MRVGRQFRGRSRHASVGNRKPSFWHELSLSQVETSLLGFPVRRGTMRGGTAVVARFDEWPNESLLKDTLETLVAEKAVSGGEIWTAASLREFPVSQEERLRGGDKKLKACMLIETLRVSDAEKLAPLLAHSFPGTAIGIYRLLCEIRPQTF
jgi:hypothetical protein